MNKLNIFRSGLIVAALLGAAHAKESPPPVAAPRPFTLPQPSQLSLPNGLKVTLVEFGAVPKVTISAVVRIGTDQPLKPWLPEFTADFLKEGAGKRSAEQIATAAANMGGGLGIGVDKDTATVGIDVLNDSSAMAIQLIADVLMQPTLPESEFERIRQDYVRNLSVARTQAQTLADDAFEKLLYGEHRYGAGLPTEAQLKALTMTDVRNFYRDNFGAQRTHLYVVGRFDKNEVEQAIRSAFGAWPEGPKLYDGKPKGAGKLSVTLIDRPGAEQSTLMIGLRVIDPTAPDFMHLSVANTLLGGSITSRITINLRESKGWAYSPGSILLPNIGDAYWAEAADVATAHTADSLKEIFKELARLRGEPPSADELKSQQNYRSGVWLLSNATRGGLVSQLSFLDLHGLPFSWLTSFVDRLYAVTPAQVQTAAKQHLDPSKMSLAIVGDLKVISNSVKALPELAGAEFTVSQP
jgi:predicted Zn-dependent peptidase